MTIKATKRLHIAKASKVAKRAPNEDQMQCDMCGKTMKSRVTTADNSYHYDLCGLDNIFLVGITVYECKRCDIEIPEIPRVEELNQVIAEALANKPALLTGQEIRFLRTRAGFSAKKFAILLNVTPEHLSRIENGHYKVLGGAADKLARVAIVDGKKVREFLSRLAEMQLKDTEQPEEVKFERKIRWEKIELKGGVAA